MEEEAPPIPKKVCNFIYVDCPGLGGSIKGKKTRVTFLKDSSVSHCVLAGYLFSSLDLVQSS